jgi:hypothetical protein
MVGGNQFFPQYEYDTPSIMRMGSACTDGIVTLAKPTLDFFPDWIDESFPVAAIRVT